MSEGRHLAMRAFRQTGKTALRFDPFGWSRRSSLFDHAITNDQHPGLPVAGVTFDQTAAKRLAPRRF
jgi:hypothetical protein